MGKRMGKRRGKKREKREGREMSNDKTTHDRVTGPVNVGTEERKKEEVA